MVRIFIKARVEKCCEELYNAQNELKKIASLPYNECKEINHVKDKVMDALIDLQVINMRLRQ